MPSEANGSLAGIVVAAGRAVRMDGVDKMWAPLAGSTVVEHAVRAMASESSELILVVRSGHVSRAEHLLGGLELSVPWSVQIGGERRQDSVAAGLSAVTSVEFVAVHDGARPLASADLLRRVWASAAETGAAIPALPVADTIKEADGDCVVRTLDRSSLWAVQTPQVFRLSLLRDAYQRFGSDGATDDAQLVELAGGKVRIVLGESRNLKITCPADLELARLMLEQSPTPAAGAAQT